MRRRGRVAVVVLLALVAQATLARRVRVAGVHPDLLSVVAVAAGVVGGPQRGAAVGFAAGLAADALVPTPLGLCALVGTLAGFAVGAAQRRIQSATPWTAPVTVGAAAALATVAFAAGRAALGQGSLADARLGTVAAVVGATGAAASFGALALVRWALADDAGPATAPAAPAARR